VFFLKASIAAIPAAILLGMFSAALAAALAFLTV
jgi:hypothetical protein